jgi:hypothetical protein
MCADFSARSADYTRCSKLKLAPPVDLTYVVFYLIPESTTVWKGYTDVAIRRKRR